MYTFESISLMAVFFAFLAGVYGLIYKGSRPLQPVPEHPTSTKKAFVAALVPVVCIANLYAIFKRVDLYLRHHLVASKPLAFIIILGVIAIWLVGIYFAYRAARAANWKLRAIGSMEVLLFLLAGALPLVARG